MPPAAKDSFSDSTNPVRQDSMNARCDEFDLRLLLDKLTSRFPGITEVYIFGSRRYRTMSTRSDVDLLLTTESHVTAEDVRDYALQTCAALDFFFVDGGLAVSCANGSKVRAKNKKDLLRRLGAIKLWERKTGFQNADVDWKFEVIKGHTPIFTTLVSNGPFPSKAQAVTSVPQKEPVEASKDPHTLVSYWSHADWSERFGMIGVFGLIFVVGFLSGKSSFFSKLYDLIKEVVP